MSTQKNVESNGQSNPLALEITDEGVAVLTYDLPGESMNTLRAEFSSAFEKAFAEVEQNPDIRAAVLISGKKDFIVGADINMLSGLKSEDDARALLEKSHDMLQRLVASKKPMVAAVAGQALGGGWEVALACHGRVATDDAVFSFPEVQLGLLPGANGLQRLADIAGFQVALDHGLTGKKMRAKKAKKLGIVADVVPRPILRETAIAVALELAKGERVGKSKDKLEAKLTKFALEENPIGRKVLFSQARKQARRKTRGHYPAPDAIVDVLEKHADEGMEASAKLEREHFGRLLQTEVSKNLRSIFFATTALKKDNGVESDAEAREVNKIAMLGAGLMGAGITYVSIDKGYEVRLKDRDAEGIGRGLKYVHDIVDGRVKKRHISKGDRLEIISRLSTTTDYSGMAHVDLVIEAVFEDLGLKHAILKEVEDEFDEDVIFASNTSSIPIGRIAEAAKRPENVVGMHYFSPVHKMPLLEVIRTEQTKDEVVATAVAVGKKQGKTVIVVNDGVGFYTSRILGPYMNEAAYILTEGAAVEFIDEAMVSWGWPVGPMALIDEVGIDVAAHVGPVMLEAFGERLTPPPTITRLVDDGRKGRKNERGFYRYGSRKKKKKGKEVDESVYAALGLDVPDPKAKPAVSKDEIRERCNLQFINEALHCWGDGILRSARDGDIGAIFGLGFPPFRGGPFRYLDAVGADEVLKKLEAYQERFGVRFTPAPALIEHVKRGGRFHDD